MKLTPSLAEAFAPEGPLAHVVPRFSPRPGQVELAQAIERTLNEGGTLVAEAATGTGKTLAYLVPALLSNKRTLISTGTLNLQSQLFARDLPMVLRALGLERKVSLLKGRANYLCQQRMEQHLAGGEVDDPETAAALEQVKHWARRTDRGEISELAELPARSTVWPLVTSTADNCLGGECPRYQDCHVVKARRAAQKADVVVVNHHLLFADLALKQTGFGEVLPGADAVILDEAHQVPDIATRFFSERISSHQLRELYRDTLAAAGQAGGVLALMREPLEALRDRTRQLRGLIVDLPERGPWQTLDPLAESIAELRTALVDLHAALEPIAEMSRELASCAERALRLRATMDQLREPPPGKIRWYGHRRGFFTLNLTPLSVAEPFRDLREELPAAWIMTSATLSVGRRFDHFLERLGLEGAGTMIVDSPFDYPEQALLWLPEDVPLPNARNHTECLLEAVLPLLEAAGGRAFLLFTSHRALKRAAAWLETSTDFELLVQETAPREALLERFLSGGRRLLLGAASFWEGVDVPGQALSVVVIDKLPFAAPDDPVLSATLDAVKDAGGNPFADLQLPQAVIALKQGIGRLIRQHSDRGVTVIGDPRLTQRAYGRLFLSSLPPMRRTADRDEAIKFMCESFSREDAKTRS